MSLIDGRELHEVDTMNDALACPNKSGVPSTAAASFRAWVTALDGEFFERAVAVRLVMLAPLAAHHVLLLGPPGTAKSLLARRVANAFSGTLFSTLLTKFSTPEDVFGPLSLPDLERGIYARQTDGYLPKADVAFVDEIFKSNASILNAMLSVLNERVYYNGAKPENVPLLSMIAASNEVPDDDDGLDALDDRILIRTCVDPVRESSAFARMLSGEPAKAEAVTPAPIPRAMVDELRARAACVPVDAEIVRLLLELRDSLRASQVSVSDRRWKQSVGLMRICAALDNETQLRPRHLGVLRYVLWRRPADQPKVVDALSAVVSNARWDRDAPITAADLQRQITECTANFDHIADRVDQLTRYGYGGRQPEFESLRMSAAESLRKAKHVVRAAREFVRERQTNGGPFGLWAPFWAGIVVRPDLSSATTSLEHHRFVTTTLPQHMPLLLADWNADDDVRALAARTDESTRPASGALP